MLLSYQGGAAWRGNDRKGDGGGSKGSPLSVMFATNNLLRTKHVRLITYAV
jgi:hypothetical protein